MSLPKPKGESVRIVKPRPKHIEMVGESGEPGAEFPGGKGFGVEPVEGPPEEPAPEPAASSGGTGASPPKITPKAKPKGRDTKEVAEQMKRKSKVKGAKKR
jgi:hypothetical protein